MTKLRILIVGVLLVVGSFSTLTAQTAAVDWWLIGSTVKADPAIPMAADPQAPLQLHAATGEYTPFQAVFRSTGAASLNLTVDYPADFFEVTVYEQYYLPLLHQGEPLVFVTNRLQSPALPDGLRPLESSLAVTPDLPAAVWVDVFVKADTPAGDYTITLNTDAAGSRQALIRVYPVALPQTAPVDVIIPLSVEWTLPFFAPGEVADFHRAVNQMLIDNYLVPGNWVTHPVRTPSGWDFSAFINEIQQLPVGTSFLTPIPYDLVEEQYLFNDANGEPYRVTDFTNAEFVAELNQFFTDLAGALQEAGRLQDALVYPTDERVWVADEPLHDGPAGFEYLAQWTQLIRAAGLRVIASWVYPAPLGEGWLPGTDVADNFHVHQDYFDASPAHYQEYIAQGYEASVYLNNYGDMIDLPAKTHRGMLWNAYADGVTQIMGYAEMEWVDQIYDLVDPWASPELVYPQFGYGGGALLWPGPQPSLRVKVLREGVEDTRLLDLYGQTFGVEAAKQFAACLTPGLFADQNPPDTLWDDAHTAILLAVTNQQPIPQGTLCQAEPVYQESQVVLDMQSAGAAIDEWENEGSEVSLVPDETDTALRVDFTSDVPTVGYYLGPRNWSGWTALQVTVENVGPYFTGFDIGLSDGASNYLLLRNGEILIGPNTKRVITMPLYIPPGETFDWASVQYMEIEASTSTTWTNGFGETQTFSLGSRTLIFDDFVLVR